MSDKLIHLLELLGEAEPDEEAIEKARGEVGEAMREGKV
jgi:hypothetical protein